MENVGRVVQDEGVEAAATRTPAFQVRPRTVRGIQGMVGYVQLQVQGWRQDGPSYGGHLNVVRGGCS
jgi:hypothetical protein